MEKVPLLVCEECDGSLSTPDYLKGATRTVTCQKCGKPHQIPDWHDDEAEYVTGYDVISIRHGAVAKTPWLTGLFVRVHALWNEIQSRL